MRLILTLVVLLAGGLVRGADAQMAGVLGLQVSLASPHAFHLHLDLPVAANPKLSGPGAGIYLAAVASWHLPAFTTSTDGQIKTYKTEFGAVQVDGAKKQWRLLDANGGVLADWASINGNGNAGVGFTIGKPAGENHPLLYGAGNAPDVGALTQSHSADRMSNGRTALPQFWSSAGFGVLAAGEYGDHPASWKSRTDGGVDLTFPGNSVDLYLIPVRSLSEWLRDYDELTGFTPVPPRWAFGYMQSRWGWESRAYIDDTLAHFRKDALPVDAFIFDFEWYTQEPDYEVPPQGDPKFVDFGWNPALFPDPANQIAAYLKQGLHVIGIRKPRIGNAQALADARAKGWIFAGDPNDTYEGKTRERNLDFSQKAVREYWAENNRKFLDAGMAGFWNDEGELTYTKYSYWNLAETDLLQQVRPGARFFSLNRSYLPGMQRFGAAMWTGDINGDWPTLARTAGELLSLGLSGMPYTTCDIGGFAGKAPAELVVRWMEAGVFFPLMRSHSVRGEIPHFPWLYGTEAEGAIRQALDLRYRLIPYYYSLAHETAETGLPIMRPLVMEYPDDPAVAAITDEWMMGSDLLAAPVLTAGGKRTVHLPKDTWYRLGSSERIAGPADVSVNARLEEIPVYVRAGTILPLGPVLQYTGQPRQESLEMHVYPGNDGSFILVEDDGATTGYETGAARRTVFGWDDAKQQLNWRVTNGYSGDNVFKAMKVVLFSTAGQKLKTVDLGQDGIVDFK